MTIPSINMIGQFELTAPYVAKSTVRYKVTAIRKFSDLYIRGVDVYAQFYKPHGLITGEIVNGKPFDFNTESSLNPVIVTLEGNDDSVIYVPSSYIKSNPSTTDIPYSRMILSIDLGALPDHVNLEAVMTDIEGLVETRIGSKPTVKMFRGYTDRQPTVDEHYILEESRVGGITASSNDRALVIKSENIIKEQNNKIKVMTKILSENKLI